MKRSNWSEIMALIHDLDEKYEKLSDIPDGSPELMELQRKMQETPKVYAEKTKERIMYFLYKGTPLDEICTLTETSPEQVKKLAMSHGITLIDRFIWVNKKGVYAQNYHDYREFYGIDSVPKARKVYGTWKDLPLNSIYLIKNKLYKKTKLDVRNFKKEVAIFEVE